jgi:hypothetical protein
MQPTTASSRPALSDARPPSPPRPACPLCNGTLIELRGLLRCSRCYFTLCEGCGGGTAEDVGAAR